MKYRIKIEFEVPATFQGSYVVTATGRRIHTEWMSGQTITDSDESCAKCFASHEVAPAIDFILYNWDREATITISPVV